MTVISRNYDLLDKLSQALDKSLNRYLKLDTKAIAKEFLSEERAKEQIDLFIKEVNKFESYDFKGKKLLEIGAAVGTHLIAGRKNYGIEAFGIEPSEDEFSPFKEISSILMKENNLPENIIQNGVGENIPFPDNSFDLIYSTNVIEHVQNPKKVFSESFRVLKSGGFLQFVIPNYFSFWEGHYGMFWPCIINKFPGKLYVKLMGKNPAYVDTLQLINPFYLKNILSEYKDKIKIIGWGKEVFQNRLQTGNYSDWASLKRIRPIIQLVQNLKVATLAAKILNLFEMYTPIVLTVKKIGG